MTLAAKISMCLALWNPSGDLHRESAGLLSYWYNQEMFFIEQAIKAGDKAEGMKLHLRPGKPFLSWAEFKQYFSLPNSDYIPIPDCIQASSEEV